MKSTDFTDTGEHPVTSTAPRSEGAEKPSRSSPEFFRLPKSGVDPYFGLGRSYYYEGEKQGFWKLVRIRQRGKLRGITLVPYDAVAAFIRNQADGGSHNTRNNGVAMAAPTVAVPAGNQIGGAE